LSTLAACQPFLAISADQSALPKQIPTTMGRVCMMSGKNKGGREIRKPKQPKPAPIASPGKPGATAGG
jgi:hypothetical protein